MNRYTHSTCIIYYGNIFINKNRKKFQLTDFTFKFIFITLGRIYRFDLIKYTIE